MRRYVLHNETHSQTSMKIEEPRLVDSARCNVIFYINEQKSQEPITDGYFDLHNKRVARSTQYVVALIPVRLYMFDAPTCETHEDQRLISLSFALVH